MTRRKYDHDKIKSMILEDIRDQDIADEIRCHVTHVRKLRQDMGIYKRKHGIPHQCVNYSKVEEMYFKVCNDYEIAAELGCSPSSVMRWRMKKGYPSINKVKKMVKNGEAV